MMLRSFKDKVEKISQATEERLNTVKTALQKKLNENDKKPKDDIPDNSEDLLQGWTMLGGDRSNRNKNVEFEADNLSGNPDHALDDLAHALPVASGELIEVPLGISLDSQVPTISNSNDANNENVNHTADVDDDTHLSYGSDDEQVFSTSRVANSPPTKSIPAAPTPKSAQSEETVGWFGLLTSAIIWNILSLVDAFDLCQLSQTSSHFFKLATNEFLWERLYIKIFRKNNLKVDKALWYEQLHYGGYRSLYGTKLCEDQLTKTLRSLHNTEHNAVEWICKPLVSVQSFFSSTNIKIIMFGLDGSGKTSILYKLVRGESVKTDHTIGFNTEKVDYKGYNFEIWDLEHKPKNSFEFWKTYFTRTNGIIFVVDGTAPELLPQAKACLESFTADSLLSQLPLLVYVNKRDVMESMSTLQVLVGLNLHYLCNRSGWHIQPCSVIENDYSLEEGLDWFCETFRHEEVQRLKTKIVS